MNILIIGTGNMGRGIATRALAGKNTVILYGSARVTGPASRVS